MQQSFTASAGCGQRFSAVYTNTFMFKVSRGLDKPNPKLLGQDKPRLELAMGSISCEHRFCTIILYRVFAAYISRGQSKPRLIFSRINGPTCIVKTYVSRNMHQ